MKKAYLHFKQRILVFLRQGESPHELALAISLGVIIGMFPVQGTTTLICTLVAVLFRLNLVVIQLANYLSFPLMMLMLVPFYSTGNLLFGNEDFLWDIHALIRLFRENFWAAINILSSSIGYAVVVWMIFAPVGTFVIYLLSLKIMKRFRIQAT